jgi:hypothetical protein
LHVNTWDNIGGAAILADHLCQSLIEKGFHSRMLVKKKYSDHEYTTRLKQNSSLSKYLLDFFQIRNKWGDFFESSSINILKNQNFIEADIIHLHNIHGSYFNPLLLTSMTRSKPTIWTLHDVQEIKYPCDNYKNCDLWKTGCINCKLYDKDYFDKKRYLVWNEKRMIFDRSDFSVVCPSYWLKQ